MSDDDLRRRLHEIPPPTTRLDVDAAIAGARRTRRPKVAAVTAATAGAGILIIAPFVAPGLQSFQPTSAPGLAEDAGAPAEEAGPASGQESGTGGGDSGAGETLSEPAAGACGLTRAGDVGLVLAFATDPADGAAPVWISTAGADAVEVAAIDVRSLALVDDGARVAGGGEQEALTLEPGRTVQLAAESAVLPADACGEGEPAGPSPVALVAVDGAAPVPIVGDPWTGDVR
ncbi:hypothetical protein [Agrococcus sp. DT81.2]|uniref:hypothetical protein n=1 Tax=Agrococcus sp. DT81.2 TaxID=3393414 RepID=UPI003CE501CC